jgi:hypothetical protein
MMRRSINVFLIKFKNEIAFTEIPLLRGAVLNLLGSDAELLFHNHTSDTTFRYSYPLIQYKRIRKKAAIFCIGDGVETIGKLLNAQDYEISLGSRNVCLDIENISPKRNIVQTWDSTFHYYLTNWLALNSTNYQEYMAMDDLADRIDLLERILVGNLLSFAKGVGIEIEQQIICKLISFEEPRLVKVKGVKVMSFNCEFTTNMSLPDYMGIGKHASIGYGTVVKDRTLTKI